MINNILELNHTKLSRYGFQTTVIITVNLNSYNNKNQQQQRINSDNNYFSSSRQYLPQHVISITTYNYNFTLSQFNNSSHITSQLNHTHATYNETLTNAHACGTHGFSPHRQFPVKQRHQGISL